MSCDRYRNAKGETYEEKARACRGCTSCNNNPPLRDEENGFRLTKEIEARFVARIERLRLEMKTFPDFNYNDLDYVDMELLKVWVQHEEMFEHKHKANLNMVIQQILAMQSQ